MANTPNLNLVKPASTDNYDVAVQNGNMDIVDAAVKALQDGTTAAQVLTKILSVDGAGSGLDADKVRGADGAAVCLFKSGTGTYTDNDTAQTFTDAFCTASSLVIVAVTAGTPAGIWTVDSGNGSFTISSTAAESADIAFDYYIQKAVG